MATSAIFGSAIYGDSLYGVVFIQGSTNLNFQTESLVKGAGRLVGTSSLTFDDNATLTSRARIQAFSTLVVTSQSRLKGVGSLNSAQSSLIFTLNSPKLILSGTTTSPGETSISFNNTANLLATANSFMDSVVKFNSESILFGYGKLPSAFSNIIFGYEATLNKARLRAPAISATFNVSADELNYTTTLPWYNTIGKNRLPYDNSSISTLLPLYIDTVGTNRLPYQNTKKEAV